MKSYLSHEVLLTTPNLPLRDSFSSLELNNTDSPSISYDEIEELPKRPYISQTKKFLNQNLFNQLVEERKDSIEITETTDISRGTKKKVKVPTSRNALCRNYYSSNFIHKQKKPRDDYKLLRMYWKEKERIEDKYKKMIANIEKEAAIELSRKISTLRNTKTALESIEDLSKLQDYYEDSKFLLNEQRVMEQEELLKEFQKKTFI